jgi:hypothetical protein
MASNSAMVRSISAICRSAAGACLNSGRGFAPGFPVVILGIVWWLPLLVFAAIAGFWLWGRYRTRQRGPAVARFASQHALSYSAVGYVESPGYDFPLLREVHESDRSGYNNVLAGRWQDLPVKEADYWYSTRESVGGQVGRYRSYFSIVVVDLAAAMPYVSVQTKNLFTGAPGQPGMHEIDFESEDFNRKFSVTAPDKEFAIKLIDAGMIQWLMSTGGEFAFDLGGCNLLVWCGQLPATGLARLFDAATGFTDHIPHVVWAEYGAEHGGRAANSPGGGTPR